jgi:hypothetical protein
VSRVDQVRARYEAEMAVAELEDELVAAKGSGTPDEVRDVKARLREARRAFREQRSGDATAAPETVTVTADVTEAGAR